jgi:two-component system, response regulator RegA
VNAGCSVSMLVVDDDDVFRERMTRALRERGLAVRAASTAEEAIALARAGSPDLALVDLRMPGSSGLELIRALKSNDPATRVVVLTGYGSIATAVEAIHLGATNYLSKPVDADEVLAAFGDRLGADRRQERVPSLARVQWEHINRVLCDCDGNISKAARLLGMHRRSLQRKLCKYPTAR